MATEYSWNANDPNDFTAMDMRRRIALQMLGRGDKKGFPKTLGEGLASIGDALGDMGTMKALERQALAEKAAGLQSAKSIYGPSAAPAAAGPGPQAEDDTGPVTRAVADAGIVPQQDEQPVEQQPDTQPAARLTPQQPFFPDPASTVAANTPQPEPYRPPINAIRPPQAIAPWLDRTVQQYFSPQSLSGRGVPAAAGNDYSYPPTAMATTGTVNDAVPEGVSGISPKVGAGAGQSYRDLIAQRPPDQLFPPPGVAQPNPTAGAATAASSPLATVPGGADPRLAQAQAAIPPGTATDIKPAPVLPPAIGQPGYVMQKPVPPPPPEKPTMSPRETNARRALVEQGDNPWAVRAATAVIGEEQAKTKYEQDQATALYNARVQHYNALDTTYQTWLANADTRRRAEETHSTAMQKAPYEVTKAKQETEAPITREVEGRIYQYDRGKQAWADVTPGPQAAPNLTEDQAKNLNYYQRGKRALADLGDGQELNDFWKWYSGGMPVVGNYLAGAKFQEQYNAAKEFAAIILRRESGAAVTANELKDVMDRYIPKPGATPELVLQKEYMRNGQVSSLRDALGKATPIADRFDKTFDEERQRLRDAQAVAAQTGKPSAGITELPPIRVNSPEERAALKPGRRYMRPGSDEILVKGAK